MSDTSFQGGENFSRGVPPCAPLVTGLIMTLTQQWRYLNLLQTSFTCYFLWKASWIIVKSFLAVSTLVLTIS